MKERPILFSAPMVRAILDGKKTVTRRIINFPLNGILIDRLLGEWPLSSIGEIEGDYLHYEAQTEVDDSVNLKIKCPYGKIGDRLWVRETWSHDAPDLETCKLCNQDALFSMSYGPYYKATEVSPETLKWKPSIFMPRWASRITLEITDVKCERLLEIKENDAIKEGFSAIDLFTARGNFLKLFGELNGNESIVNNVFVWVIEFIKVDTVY